MPMNQQVPGLNSPQQKRPTAAQAWLLLVVGVILLPGPCFVVVSLSGRWTPGLLVLFLAAMMICSVWGSALLIMRRRDAGGRARR